MAQGTIDDDFLQFRRTGDPEAMARVFDSAAPRLLLVAHHFVRDTGRAEDLVQSVFLAAIQDAGQFDGERAVLPWLVGILSNRAKDHLRRESTRRAEDLGPDVMGLAADDPALLAESRELAERASDAIDALPPKYREVLLLRIVHGLEPIQIAHALGRAPGTVRMQLQRGGERLRKSLPRETALSALALVEPARGLGPVRQAIVARAAELGPTLAGATTTTAVGLGGLLVMKTTLMSVLVGVAVLAVWWFGSGDEGAAHEPRPERPENVAVVTASPLIVPGALEEVRTAIETVGPTVERSALVVRVVRSSGGGPVVSAGVYARHADRLTLGMEATTGADGTARFEGLRPGSWRVDLDRAASSGVTVPVQAGRVAEARLVLEPGVTVEGIVESPTGEPVPGARVYRTNPSHHDFLQPIVTADDTGRFRLEHVAADTSLVARAKGWQPSQVGRAGVRSRVAGPVEIRLVLGAPGTEVHGIVRELDGAPSPHALVAITVDEDAREGGEQVALSGVPAKPRDTEAWVVRADAEGRFVSSEVPAGRVTLLARPLDHKSELVAWSVVDVGAGIPTSVDLHLTACASLVGRVTDGDGRPVPDLSIEVEWEGSTELGAPADDLGPLVTDRSASTDANGTYRVGGLFPGAMDASPRIRTIELKLEAILTPGEVRRWDLVVEVPSDLRLACYGVDGAPLVDWMVALPRRDGRINFQDMVRPTDREGCFVIEDLPPRTYQVSLHAPMDSGKGDGIPVYTTLPTAVRSGIFPGPETTEIRLAPEEVPGVSVRGRWVDATGEPLARARFELRRDDWNDGLVGKTDDEGRFRFGYMVPGDYVLYTSTGRYPASSTLAEFRANFGEDVDLGEVSLLEPARVQISLTGPEGERLERAEVIVRHAEGDVARARFRGDDPVPPIVLWPGEYTVHAYAEGFAPLLQPLSIPVATESVLALTLPAGEDQWLRVLFERDVDAESDARGSVEGRVDVFVEDGNGELVIDERMDAPIEDGAAWLHVPLSAGRYNVRLVDHRVRVSTHRTAQFELVVHEGDAPAVEVRLDGPGR